MGVESVQGCLLDSRIGMVCSWSLDRLLLENIKMM